MNNINIKELTCRILFAFIGVFFIGIGVAFLKKSGFGTDPFTMMNLGVSKAIGSSLGVYQLKVNIVLFFVVLLLARGYIGLGMVINMVLCGFMVDNFSLIIPNVSVVQFKLMFTIIGVVVTCFGVALYTYADLGIAPYDAIAWIIQNRTNNKIKFRMARIITDVICVAIGISYGGLAGINTIIMAFFTGPLVQFFKNIIEHFNVIDKFTVKKSKIDYI